MSLDALAREAARDLLTAAAARDVQLLRLDVDRRLARHRRRTAFLAAALVLAIVLGGLAVVSRRHDSAVPPAGPKPTPTPTGRPTANGLVVVAAGKRFMAVDPVTGLAASQPRLAQRVSDAYWLAASPDGSRLLVDQGENGPLLYDLAKDRLVATGYCRAPCWPAWSPDGREMAVSDQGELAVVDVETGARRVLVPRSPDVALVTPSWSADGTRVAYLDLSGRSSLVVVRATDGTPLSRLALGTAPRVFQAAWSPDGTRIALLAKTGALTADGRLLVELVAVSDGRLGPPRLAADVGHCFCVGFAPGMTWSPDGRQLAVVAFGGRPPAGDGLNIMAADGRGLHLVATTSGGTPAWLPVAR